MKTGCVSGIRLAGNLFAMVLLAVMSAGAQASVVVSGTRVVFPSSEREVSVRLSNEGQTPSLVQAWLDNGDEEAAPDAEKVPFVLMPPVFRIDQGKGQTLRMLFNGTPLPQDRESLFWLNVLEVPPKPENADAENYLQMAFRTRIKVFYRPAEFNTHAALLDAHHQLRWRAEPAADGGYTVFMDNPTPYHMNLLQVDLLTKGDQVVGENKEGGMVAPHEQGSFPVTAPSGLPGDVLSVRYTYINDFGAAVKRNAPIAVAPR